VARQGRARDDDPVVEATVVGAAHVRATAALLRERSTVLDRAVREGRAAVVGTAYALGTGRVELLEGADDVGASPAA
jgi:carbonic anhydrase